MMPREGSKVTENQCYTADFKDGGRSHEPVSTVLGAGKDKETDNPLDPLEAAEAYCFLDFGLMTNTLISAQ